MYKDIQTAGEELYGNDWGCAHLDTANLADLKSEYPNGQLVTTLNGDYWLWQSLQIKD